MNENDVLKEINKIKNLWNQNLFVIRSVKENAVRRLRELEKKRGRTLPTYNSEEFSDYMKNNT